MNLDKWIACLHVNWLQIKRSGYLKWSLEGLHFVKELWWKCSIYRLLGSLLSFPWGLKDFHLKSSKNLRFYFSIDNDILMNVMHEAAWFAAKVAIRWGVCSRKKWCPIDEKGSDSSITDISHSGSSARTAKAYSVKITGAFSKSMMSCLRP